MSKFNDYNDCINNNKNNIYSEADFSFAIIISVIIIDA